MIDRSKPLILGVGELLWDLLPGGKQLGGAPANFAYHAHALGGDARVISAIGQDAFGGEAIAQLRAVQLDTACVLEDAAHPTGVVEVALGAHGHPRYTIVENVAWDFIPTTAAALHLAKAADAICFGTLAQRAPVSRETIRTLVRQTSPDCLRILDVNLRAPFVNDAVIRESLPLASVLKLNDEELPVVARCIECAPRENAFLAHLFDTYPRLRLVALTRGADGALLVTPDDRVELPALRLPEVVDTVGAGDAFTAAVTLGWLRAEPLEEIGRNAIGVAGFVCSRHGAMPDMREYFRHAR